MEVRCPQCGEANPERAKFCLECGTPLRDEPPGAGRESRRTVTVVFADMVGFTTLGERLDQESLRRVMDRFYAEMRQAIEGQDGTLAKFIGDAVLAVWGTPEVREDDALRAVRAAEAMRRSLASVNEELERRWGVKVGMRTGVNTGEVVVDPARPADLLVGDTLNVAARLEQAATDGEVLIGPDTQRLVRADTVLEPVEPLALKGKARPMPAWRLVDGTRPDRRAAPRLEAPLVGRASELRRLREAFDLARDSRECRLVTVIGSPGLGKTRLVAEFVRSLDGKDATVLEGRCEASGEGITFQPVAEVVRMAAGIGEDDSADDARASLQSALPDDEPERERIADRLAALLGLAPPTSTEETFWAVRRLLESVARRGPVVLVHEDIHWGQPTFLDLLEYLAEWVRDVPLLIVALARPELREVRPRLTEASAVPQDVVALEPLDADTSRSLVEGLLGRAELPAELAERVLETTDGNPLFLGEMLRMLADDGVLKRDGDRWVANEQSGAIAVPPTINALLSARIERLGSEERSVVERASVIGHQFYRGAVAELVPSPMCDEVDGALTTLQRKELVRPEEALWLDERVFRFHHVLIRDAAYRSLLKEARADLHERFADWLERKIGDAAAELEEVVAFHLEQAHRYRLELGPLDERGEALATRAAARLHSAGRRALAREDLPAAINLLRRALEPLPRESEERPEVLIDLAEALLSAGDTVGAADVVDALGLGADEAEDERLGAWATALAGQLDNLTGSEHVRDTAEAATEAAAILGRVGDRAGEAKAHQVVAQAEALLGQVAAAEAALDRALVAARAAGDRRRVTSVLSGSPRAALWGPAPIVRASGRCLDVVRILRMTPGTRHVEAAALRCQAVLEAMRGRPDAARAILDGCRATFEELGLAFELHETAVHAGLVELLAGDAEAATAQLTAARDGFLGLHVEGGAAQASALLARALLDQGRDEEAVEATRFAEERGGEDLKTTIAWLGARAEALARGGDRDDALPLAERAVALAEPTDALADKADALMALARVRELAGDTAGASEAASRARELYEQKDHVVGVERAAALAGGGGAAVARAEVEAGTDHEVTPHLRAYLDAHARRDWDALRTRFADDVELVDHRPLGWDAEQWRGVDQMIEQQRSLADSGLEYELRGRTIRAESGVEASLLTFSGAEPHWVGELVVVEVVRDGVTVRAELFPADDEKAALAGFERLRFESELRGTPIGETWFENTRSANARDWEAHRATYADDFVQIDHRPLGWDAEGADAIVELTRSWLELAPDARLHPIRLDGHTDHAVCGAFGGSGTVDGVEVEVALGFVGTEEGGRYVHNELFEPDDVDAIRARFEELTAEKAGEPVSLRVWKRWAEAVNATDWDGMADCYDDDFLLIDRRGLGWEETRGRDGILALLRGFEDLAPEGEMRLVRVVAASDEAMAIVFKGSGTTANGSSFEMELCHVEVFADGRFVYIEQFEPGDDDVLLARFEELTASGTRPVHPYLRAIVEYNARVFNDRRWEDYRDCVTDDHVLRDRRVVAETEVHGPDEMVALFKQAVEVIPGLQQDTELLAGEVLPDRRRVAAFISSYHVPGEDSLLSDLRLGSVVCLRGRKVTLVEAFDDVDDVLARYDELRAERASEPASLRVWKRWAEAMNARDWDAVRGVYDDDFVQIDRRALGWEEIRGAESIVALLHAFDEMDSEGQVVFGRVVAASDEAIAIVFTADGHSQEGSHFTIEFGHVEVIADGRIAYAEQFEPDDALLIARFDQLTAPGVRPVHPLVRAITEYNARAFNERRWDDFRRAAADGCVIRDLRLVADTISRGPDEMLELFKGAVEVTPGLQQRTELVAGEVLPGRMRISAFISSYHVAEGGSLMSEVRMGSVAVVRGLVATMTDALEDDVDAVLAHYDEVRAKLLDAERLQQTAAGRVHHEFIRCFDERDWEAMAALFHDDYTRVDHRHAAWEAETSEKLVETLRGWVELAPDARLQNTTLALSEHYVAAVTTGKGTVDGSPFELAIGVVIEERDGQIAYREAFEPDDTERVLACFDRLRARRELEDRLAETVIGRLHLEYVRTFNERDWDAFRRLFGDDYVQHDQRAAGWGELDADGFVATMREWTHMAPDAKLEIRAVHGQTEHVLAAATAGFGTVDGSAFEIVIGFVVEERHGQVARLDSFEGDDEEAIRARFEEWKAGR